jgi:hypothetical protein
MKKVYHFKGDAMQPEMKITFTTVARQKLSKIKTLLIKHLTYGNSDN